jgi:hypothetical protein
LISLRHFGYSAYNIILKECFSYGLIQSDLKDDFGSLLKANTRPNIREMAHYGQKKLTIERHNQVEGDVRHTMGMAISGRLEVFKNRIPKPRPTEKVKMISEV